MSEHRGSTFVDSCIKVPVDPYSRQPTPLYERPKIIRKRIGYNKVSEKKKTINSKANDSQEATSRETLENFIDFIESIPDYSDVNHLSNEQFKQKVDYLRRKQRLLLKNLKNYLEQDEPNTLIHKETHNSQDRNENGSKKFSNLKNKKRELTNYSKTNLRLNGKKCNFEESRINSPNLYNTGSFDRLADDQEFFKYRYKDNSKTVKTIDNSKIQLDNNKLYIDESESSKSSSESLDVESDQENNLETKSLPPCSPEKCQSTLSEPFNFNLRENADEGITVTRMENHSKNNGIMRKKKRRYVRPIPLTSKIPLYHKIIAAREERSRIIREESKLNLMSQMRPFKLECEQRARKCFSRSSPELDVKEIQCDSRFKAKPIPKNLFNTAIYDRMLEDEYQRSILNKMRALALMKSSTLPPSMAKREQLRLTSSHSHCYSANKLSEEKSANNVLKSARILSATSIKSRKSKSALTTSPTRGNNLASVLRCQASREKIEREKQQGLEEIRRDELMRLREFFISQKPAWKALRSAARHEHTRDLNYRIHLRRNEAREQAERHRFQMEMMLDRVTRIPTLFERHSQNFHQSSLQSILKLPECSYSKKKNNIRKRQNSVDSFISGESGSRSNTGSLTSSSGTLGSFLQSTESSNSKKSQLSTNKLEDLHEKKIKRGPLKVSINETAELIEEDKLSVDERILINSRESEKNNFTVADRD